MYLNNGIDNCKKSPSPRLPEKLNEKEITLKNANNFLSGRQCVVNASDIAVFSTCSKS